MLDKLLIFAFKLWLGFVTGQPFIDMVIGGSFGARIQFSLRVNEKLLGLALGIILASGSIRGIWGFALLPSESGVSISDSDLRLQGDITMRAQPIWL